MSTPAAHLHYFMGDNSLFLYLLFSSHNTAHTVVRATSQSYVDTQISVGQNSKAPGTVATVGLCG